MSTPTAGPSADPADDPSDDLSEESLRYVGTRDVTDWATPAGRELVRRHRRLTQALGDNGALILSLTIGGAISVAAAYGASRIFDEVSGRTGIAALDKPVLAAAERLRSPALDAAAASIARVFGPIGMPIMTLSTAALLSRHRGSRTPLILMTAAGIGSLLMTLSGKDMVKRNRPPHRRAIKPFETTPSFPSGHTLNATAITGTLAYLLVLEQKGQVTQAGTIAAAAGTAAAVGASRVLLGAHWFTDVLVGWTTGAGWVSLVITSHRLYLTTRSGAREERHQGTGR